MPVLPLDLPTASASGIGSLPGTEPLEAAPLPMTLLPGLPYLPELPARGPGADMIGRAFGILAELYVTLAPSGWRFAEHAGRDHSRARGYLHQDLDALEERGQAYEGLIKVQVAGPWTLAATVELHYGDKALADRGACRDIAASLAEGLREHVADVRKRLPLSTGVVVQLDEPALPGVLDGTVRTASGFGTLRAVEANDAEATLRSVVEALAADGVPVVVHCCAGRAPVGVLRRAGFAGLALDFGLLPQVADDEIGELMESGGVLLAGLVPSLDQRAGLSPLADTVAPVAELWNRLGLPAALLARVVPVPTCGLAGASPAYARAATQRCADAARTLADLADGGE
ncbi:methionine synthase [Sporichthya sp.]|uniref:methionine synthase n=1 Tax=Sporichthya sp. TaxID=65475 RepID=UPI00179775DC|nr:methionine synthase [Sporichthya sp.]MBA3743370.1 methionine synthase [Sporichthya sp.]